MRKEYDFSNSIQNPYAKKVKNRFQYAKKVFMEYREEGKERVVLKAESKDDDIVKVAMGWLKG